MVEAVQRYRTAPPDLVLCGMHHYMADKIAISFVRPLCGALRDTGLSRSVISAFALDGEDVRHSGIKSLALGYVYLNIFDSLSLYRLPELRYLRLLTNAGISSWACPELLVASQTALVLMFEPRTAQPHPTHFWSLYSIFRIIGNRPTFRVPPCRLKKLH